MTRHLSLLNFTDRGITNVKNSANRADAFRQAVEKVGGKVIAQYWALGEFDGCVIFETPDDQSAAVLLATLGQDGNVRTKTQRVFDEVEFQAVMANL